MKIINFLIISAFFLLLPHYLAAQKSLVQSDTIVYEMDTISSYLEWQCDNHFGVVPLKKGKIEIYRNRIVEGKFLFKMDSIRDIDIDNNLIRKTLQNTLKSEFFFDVKNYPFAELLLDYAEKTGKNNYRVSGNLWIKGLVNCIDFSAKIFFDEKTLTATTDKFQIDRTLWNIKIYSQKYSNNENIIVSDEINFVVHLKGIGNKK